MDVRVISGTYDAKDMWTYPWTVQGSHVHLAMREEGMETKLLELLEAACRLLACTGTNDFLSFDEMGRFAGAATNGQAVVATVDGGKGSLVAWDVRGVMFQVEAAGVDLKAPSLDDEDFDLVFVPWQQVKSVTVRGVPKHLAAAPDKG